MNLRHRPTLPFVVVASLGCRSAGREQAELAPADPAFPRGSADVPSPQASAGNGGGASGYPSAGGGSEPGAGGATQFAGAAAATARRITPGEGGGELIQDCQPCEVTLSATGPSYAVEFETSATAEGRTVRAVRLSRADRPGYSQELTIHDMLPIAAHEKFIFGATDINFDGRADLLFSTRRGTSNVYADYWLFVPETEDFQYLGNYPTFRVDAVHRELSTYEGGGAAGLIYEKNQYRFIDGRLTLTQQEKQDDTDEPDEFIKTVSRLNHGKLREVSRQRVTAPQPTE